MKAEIITIGDELLIGQVIDSNSAAIARRLNSIGIEVYQIISISDNETHIIEAISAASKRDHIVLMTGGLGPTKDDITKRVLCEYFNDELVLHEATLAHLTKFFSRRDMSVTPRNKRQAMLPSKAQVLENKLGTAPAMCFEVQDFILVSMPGVPSEMKYIMQTHIIPFLKLKADLPYIIHRTLKVYGLPESMLADKIISWEDSLPPHLKLAYLPSGGRVRLRLTARGEDKIVLEKDLQSHIVALYQILGTRIKGEDEKDVEHLIAAQMQHKRVTLALAESCTGGAIAQRITSLPGASVYFLGGIIPYASIQKTNLLQISPEIIAKHSVVSAEVAEIMAQQTQQLFGADYAIATTGQAGPDKGDSDADIGQVFIAVATPHKVYVTAHQFGHGRELVIQRTVNASLDLLLGYLQVGV